MERNRPNQMGAAHPRSPLSRNASIPAFTCPNLSTKRYARPPLRSDAKSMISSWKGSVLR
jgi:hypothetical protein